MIKNKYCHCFSIAASILIVILLNSCTDEGFSNCPPIQIYNEIEWGASSKKFAEIENNTENDLKVIFHTLGYTPNYELFQDPKKYEYTIKSGEKEDIQIYFPKGDRVPILISFEFQAFLSDNNLPDYSSLGWKKISEPATKLSNDNVYFTDYGFGWYEFETFFSELVVDEKNDPIPNAISHFVVTFREGEEKPTWEVVRQ
ncbi:MAG: hypothetical protein SPI86_03190 [Treponemataceae bacterium]|nr:hypothetical protein [Spirochaetales bacterium]MDY6030749.1 hypothetical protein [Treponemataceae bacterium]